MLGRKTWEKPVRGDTDTWLTPLYIIEALGTFDLDPCCPVGMLWRTAEREYNVRSSPGGGLTLPWEGRVWLNPPYGPATARWVRKMAQHGKGTALVFARTETTWFQRWCLGYATGILFLRGRIKFLRIDGTVGEGSPAPTVLVAYGHDDFVALCDAVLEKKLSGYVVDLNRPEPEIPSSPSLFD